VHLDQLYWSAGWVEMPKQEWSRVVDDLLLRDEWIIDGNYSGTLEKRIAKCDTIIFLDMSSILCLWRIVKRRFLYRRGTRPDMAEGCEEHLNLKFALWVLNYPRKSRPKIVKLLEENGTQKQIVWLRSRPDVEEFLFSAGMPMSNKDKGLKPFSTFS